jgi:hypothetical protein
MVSDTSECILEVMMDGHGGLCPALALKESGARMMHHLQFVYPTLDDNRISTFFHWT